MPQERTWVALALIGTVLVGLITLSGVVDGSGDSERTTSTPSATPTTTPTSEPPAVQPEPVEPAEPAEPVEPVEPATLPHGGTRIFEDDRFLVAYYGTARTGALGVLGETSPDRMVRRLRTAARPFKRPGSKVQPVFELIVTVADAGPGRDRDYNHDIARRDVQRYIDAAHEHGALLLLDLQPGRAGFLSVAKRWKWALKDPYVGLALDPEWRMGKRGVPGRRIGSVDATEVNRVSYWLKDLVKAEQLPQKLFVLHQFRSDMIKNIGRVKPRTGLAMVQHVDGFGTPSQKLDTYRAVMRPRQFSMGFKLFYDEDTRLLRPGFVRAIRPKVRFVSYQ